MKCCIKVNVKLVLILDLRPTTTNMSRKSYLKQDPLSKIITIKHVIDDLTGSKNLQIKLKKDFKTVPIIKYVKQ